MSVVAVFDVGKTNVKLVAMDEAGQPLEALTTPNPVLDGPPYRHHDLTGLEAWLHAGLADLGSRHQIRTIVTCAHGGSGVLIGEDAPALPLADYEQTLPDEVNAFYRAAAGSFRERGSAIMLGATHPARQLLWMEQTWPEAFRRGRAFLAIPQYWAWRLCGVAASEVTSLGAQSHLWCVPERRPSSIVVDRGWEHLLPPLAPAWATLGRLRPELARRTGLGLDTRILCGIHDSSANFYRYQATGLSDFAVVSTGTWIVALCDRPGVDFDAERPGLSCNADVLGNPVPGMLTMGGREFAAIAGPDQGPSSRRALTELVAQGTCALPFFDRDDGLFPGRAGKGRIEGPPPGDAESRLTLAVLYAALLTAECLVPLPPVRTVVLDGNFVRDPLFGAIVQALLPGTEVRTNRDSRGTQAGAALLATHQTRRRPAAIDLERPDAGGLPDLASYRAAWRNRIRDREISL